MQYITGSRTAAAQQTEYFPPEPRRKLGTDAARAIGLVSELRSAGAEYELELPRVVFAGKQSSGKSSVVKALTGVQLPRNYGTCTRCPIEVTTKSSPGSAWRCRISLRITEDDETREQLPKPEIKECRIINEKDRETMPDEIENAQKTLLNRATTGQNFTKNVLCVNIAGESCPDLSLVDLPGLIQSTENKEDEGDIERIEALVREYVSSDKTIILQCIACDEDIENQSIRKLARDVDPNGIRSIGVLTKPDKVDPGTEANIVKILKGEKYELAQGYYAVRTPKQEELNRIRKSSDNAAAFEEARNIENYFFSKHEIGKGLHDHAPGRCGSDKLLNKLSSMLQKIIKENIPEMKKKLEKVLRDTERALEDLGTPIDEENVRMEIIDLARNFSNMVSTKQDKYLWRQSLQIFEDANQAIVDKSPMFQIEGKVLFASLLNQDLRSDGFLRDSVKMNVSLEDFKSICVKGQGTSIIRSAQQVLGGVTWQLLVGRESGCLSARIHAVNLPRNIVSIETHLQFTTRGLTLYTGEHGRIEATLTEDKPGQPTLFNWPYNSTSFFIEVSVRIVSYKAVDGTDRLYSLSEVSEMLDDASGRDFPGIKRSGSVVCEEIIEETVDLWIEPALACASSVHHLLRRHLIDSEQSTLALLVAPRFTVLRQSVADSVSRLLERLIETCIAHISRLVDMERPPFFTLDDFFLCDSRNQFMDIITLFDSNNICDDEVAGVIAASLSYLRIRQKIFSENVLQHVLHHLLGALEKECEKELLEGMGVTGANKKGDSELLLLFVEETDTRQKRAELENSCCRQRNALKLINAHLEHH